MVFREIVEAIEEFAASAKDIIALQRFVVVEECAAVAGRFIEKTR